MSPLALFFFGMAVGVLSGLLGVGGGVVLVPGLMLLFGLTQPQAQGTTLMVLSLPIAGFAAAVYYQHGYVQWPVVGLLAAGFALGAFGGAKLLPHVPVGALRLCFAGLLFYVAFVLALDVRSVRSKAMLPAMVAAATAFFLARLLRRRNVHHPVAPPDVHTEYHI